MRITDCTVTVATMTVQGPNSLTTAQMVGSSTIPPGSVMSIVRSEATLSAITINGVVASDAILFDSSNVVLSDSAFDNGASINLHVDAKAAYLHVTGGSSLKTFRTQFARGSGVTGGAAYLTSSAWVSVNDTFTSCVSQTMGGAVYIEVRGTERTTRSSLF